MDAQSKNIEKITLKTERLRKDEILEEIEIEDNSISYFEEDTGNLVFDPPVSHQRYEMVFNILISAKWRKDIKTITDYGCGEYRLFKYIQGFLNLREINFVDIDEKLLKEKLPILHYSNYNYLDRRFNPLKVSVFEGSFSDPDERILNSDVIIGIEIIEHLYPDTLEAVPFVIFHCVKPKIVIFSTPNADFNVVFPNFKKFRHHDHKFEWSREQFESWASNITLRFPQYVVTFLGVGNHPEKINDLGHCSQFALFVRRDFLDSSNKQVAQKYDSNSCNKEYNVNRDSDRVIPYGICVYLTKSKKFECSKENELIFYKEVYSEEHMYCDDDTRPDDVKLLEVMVRNMHSSVSSFEGTYSVPLYRILDTQRDGQLISEKEAGDILRHNGFEVTTNLIDHRCKLKWKQCVQVIVPRNTLFDSSSSESEHNNEF